MKREAILDVEIEQILCLLQKPNNIRSVIYEQLNITFLLANFLCRNMKARNLVLHQYSISQENINFPGTNWRI